MSAKPQDFAVIVCEIVTDATVRREVTRKSRKSQDFADRAGLISSISVDRFLTSSLRYFYKIHLMSIRVLAVGMMVALAGCGPSGPAAPAVFPVKGIVKKGGQPLKGVTVGLYPAGGGSAKGTPGSGVTDDAGAFEIRSTAGNGVSVGTYKLVLTAPRGEIDYASYGKKQGPPKATIEIPKKLTAESSSDRIVEVQSGSDNVVNVDL